MRLRHLILSALFCGVASLQITAQCDTLRAFVDHQQRPFIKCLEKDASDIEGSNVAANDVSQLDVDRISTSSHSHPVSHTRKQVLMPLDSARFSWIRWSENSTPVIYVVRPKETSFRIARRYFDIPVEALMMLNGLTSTDLSIGQHLIVGWYTMQGDAADTMTTNLARPTTAFAYDPFEGIESISQTGKGFWDKSLPDEGHLFAMHRTARVNSVIEIINPMFNSRITAKVIGRIPPTYTNDIDLIVSPGVAKTLGIMDSRFYIQMRYVE